MTAIDWVIVFVPALVATWGFLLGGIKLLVARIGNPNLAIGLFGVVLCWTAAASYTFLLTETARQIMSDQIMLLMLIGAGNLLLVIWSFVRPSKS